MGDGSVFGDLLTSSHGQAHCRLADIEPLRQCRRAYPELPNRPKAENTSCLNHSGPLVASPYFLSAYTANIRGRSSEMTEAIIRMALKDLPPLDTSDQDIVQRC